MFFEIGGTVVRAQGQGILQSFGQPSGHDFLGQLTMGLVVIIGDRWSRRRVSILLTSMTMNLTGRYASWPVLWLRQRHVLGFWSWFPLFVLVTGSIGSCWEECDHISWFLGIFVPPATGDVLWIVEKDFGILVVGVSAGELLNDFHLPTPRSFHFVGGSKCSSCWAPQLR